jgi:hypothetical protein
MARAKPSREQSVTPTAKVLLGAESDRVQHEVQAPECALDAIENTFERAIDLDVEGQQEPRLDGLHNRHHEGH